MKSLPSTDLAEVATRCAGAFRELEGAHVLITGAAGFVGSWMAESAAHYRAGVDGRLALDLCGRIGGNLEGVAVACAPCDSRDSLHFGDIRSLVIPDGVTHVIHCASAGSATENENDPHDVCDMIEIGTHRVASECARVGVKRLLHVSSGSVYQPKASGVYAESDSLRTVTTWPTPDIPFIKGAAEHWARNSGVPTVIARGFAMIGPRLPAQFAASQFMADALAGRPIRVTNPGTVRSYLYAADMATWLWHLLVFGEAGTAYNVGGFGGWPVGALAREISIASGVPYECGDGEPAPPFVCETRRAEAAGCPPTYGMEAAVRRWWAWERGT